MLDSYRSEIRSLQLFEQMKEDNFQSLLRGAYVQTFPAQVELATEGEPADFLSVLISGSVELFANWNNRETTMSIVRPVSTFILAATIKDAPYLMSARTLEKSRVILLPSMDVRKVFETDHDFARAVVSELAQCYRAVVKNSKELKLRTSIERLAAFVLRLHNRAHGNNQMVLPIEKRKLASQLGMSAENLSRAFNALKAYGVTTNGNIIILRDKAALESLAKPTRLIDDPGY